MIGIEHLKRHARRGILAGAAAMALAAAGGAANAAEKVTFAYGTNISLSNAPTLMAIGMGYFKEAGLDVQATFFQGAAVMLPQVTQKHITFGWITPDPLVISSQPGRDALPVKMFYNGIYLSPFEVVVTKNSPARSLADLKGKKIGVGAMSWGNLAVTKAMMKKLGLELQRDYEFVPVGVGATAFRALADDKVQALNLFDTFHVQMEQMGADLRRLPMDQSYRELFSSGWIAHQDTLRERPELVVAFARAAAKGVVACNANPQACMQNFWKLYPATKPADGTEEKKLADAVQILKVRLATMLPEQGPQQMGYYTEQSWHDYVDVLHEGGQLSTKDVDVKPLYTNQFVKDINDFDAAAVVSAAKQLK